MPRARMGDEARKLRGSYEASRSDASLIRGRVALTEILPAPDDLDRGAKAEWAIHMYQAVAAGTLSRSDLVAFRALVEAAALRRRAYKRASREGPVRTTASGGTKTNAAWSAFLAADVIYQRWMTSFGLTPKAGAGLPELPVPERGTLKVVG